MTAPVYLLRLPGEVPLTLNQRQHRLRAAATARSWRRNACLCARADRVPHLERVDVVLIGRPPTRRRRDEDNLAPTLKACIDGLRDAGVVDDDTPDHVAASRVRLLAVDAQRLRVWRWTLKITDRSQDA